MNIHRNHRNHTSTAPATANLAARGEICTDIADSEGDFGIPCEGDLDLDLQRLGLALSLQHQQQQQQQEQQESLLFKLVQEAQEAQARGNKNLGIGMDLTMTPANILSESPRLRRYNHSDNHNYNMHLHAHNTIPYHYNAPQCSRRPAMSESPLASVSAPAPAPAPASASASAPRTCSPDVCVPLVRPKPIRVHRPQPIRPQALALAVPPAQVQLPSHVTDASATSAQPQAPTLVRPVAVRPQQPARPNTTRAQQQQNAQVLPVSRPPSPLPQVIRPIPVKVLRPIPQADAEEFYRLAHQQGLSGPQVHAAVLESHDWHRKWTHQDEHNHTAPEHNHHVVHQDNREHHQPILPAAYAFLHNDRMMGAKNPSPDDWEDYNNFRSTTAASPSASLAMNQDVMERKRNRFNENHCYDRAVSSVSPFSEDDHHDKMQRHPFKRAQQQLERQSLVEAPVLIRPIPVRVVRPQAVFHPLDALSQRDVSQLPSDVFLSSKLRQLHRHVQGASQSFSSASSITCSSLDGLSLRNAGTQDAETYPPEPVHIIEDDEEEAIVQQEPCPTASTCGIPTQYIQSSIQSARDGILYELAIAGGEPNSDKFKECLAILTEHFQNNGGVAQVDTCAADSHATEGTWLTLTKPTFFANLGENSNGDIMYTLGRMSFDMFAPTATVCSLQGNFNTVERVTELQRHELLKSNAIPKALRDEVASGNSLLRTYNIIAAFTIEPPLADYPNAPNKDVRHPIRGLMTTYGYTLADPKVPNRHSVWITGGRMEPNNDIRDQTEWKRYFTLHPPLHTFGEKAKLLAVKWLMGATIPEEMNQEDGSLTYSFSRPLGGHGMAYVDTIYVDDTMRIVRGHRGTTFVFSRLSKH